jgi:hypothetical protein
MTIENATYLGELNPLYPDRADFIAEGDDQFRLLKEVLLATFPGLSEAIDLLALRRATPAVGTIVLSCLPAIPTGWVLCDGTEYTRTDGGGQIVVPDLRDKYVVSTGLVNTLLATVGANTKLFTAESAGGHLHSAATGLAGAHSHGGYTGYTGLVVEGEGIVGGGEANLSGPENHLHGIPESSEHSHAVTVASGGAHTHIGTLDVRPASVALHYICFI